RDLAVATAAVVLDVEPAVGRPADAGGRHRGAGGVARDVHRAPVEAGDRLAHVGLAAAVGHARRRLVGLRRGPRLRAGRGLVVVRGEDVGGVGAARVHDVARRPARDLDRVGLGRVAVLELLAPEERRAADEHALVVGVERAVDRVTGGELDLHAALAG